MFKCFGKIPLENEQYYQTSKSVCMTQDDKPQSSHRFDRDNWNIKLHFPWLFFVFYDNPNNSRALWRNNKWFFFLVLVVWFDMMFEQRRLHLRLVVGVDFRVLWASGNINLMRTLHFLYTLSCYPLLKFCRCQCLAIACASCMWNVCKEPDDGTSGKVVFWAI